MSEPPARNGARVEVESADLTLIAHAGFLAFADHPGDAGAAIEVESFAPPGPANSPEQRALAATGSQIRIAGRLVPSEDIDLAGLRPGTLIRSIRSDNPSFIQHSSSERSETRLAQNDARSPCAPARTKTIRWHPSHERSRIPSQPDAPRLTQLGLGRAIRDPVTFVSSLAEISCARTQ